MKAAENKLYEKFLKRLNESDATNLTKFTQNFFKAFPDEKNDIIFIREGASSELFKGKILNTKLDPETQPFRELNEDIYFFCKGENGEICVRKSQWKGKTHGDELIDFLSNALASVLGEKLPFNGFLEKVEENSFGWIGDFTTVKMDDYMILFYKKGKEIHYFKFKFSGADFADSDEGIIYRGSNARDVTVEYENSICTAIHLITSARLYDTDLNDISNTVLNFAIPWVYKKQAELFFVESGVLKSDFKNYIVCRRPKCLEMVFAQISKLRGGRGADFFNQADFIVLNDSTPFEKDGEALYFEDFCKAWYDEFSKMKSPKTEDEKNFIRGRINEFCIKLNLLQSQKNLFLVSYKKPRGSGEAEIYTLNRPGDSPVCKGIDFGDISSKVLYSLPEEKNTFSFKKSGEGFVFVFEEEACRIAAIEAGLGKDKTNAFTVTSRTAGVIPSFEGKNHQEGRLTNFASMEKSYFIKDNIGEKKEKEITSEEWIEVIREHMKKVSEENSGDFNLGFKQMQECFAELTLNFSEDKINELQNFINAYMLVVFWNIRSKSEKDAAKGSTLGTFLYLKCNRLHPNNPMYLKLE